MPISQVGLAYHEKIATKIPDHPTAKARSPSITSLAELLFLNSSAGRQQAITYKTRLAMRTLFMANEAVEPAGGAVKRSVGNTESAVGLITTAPYQSGGANGIS